MCLPVISGQRQNFQTASEVVEGRKQLGVHTHMWVGSVCAWTETVMAQGVGVSVCYRKEAEMQEGVGGGEIVKALAIQTVGPEFQSPASTPGMAGTPVTLVRRWEGQVSRARCPPV